MEQDRFQKHELVYITGFIFLILSLCFFALTAYVFPHLVFKWQYDVPEFIDYMNQWLQTKYQFSSVGSSWMIVIFFLFLAIICALIAQRASNRMDNQIYGLEPKKAEPARVREDTKETISLLLKIIVIVIAVFIGALLFQWMISIPPPQL